MLVLLWCRYVNEITGMLQALDDEFRLRAKPGTDETKVTVKNIKEAFHHVDRRKEKNEIMEWLETTVRSERNVEPLEANKCAWALSNPCHQATSSDH